MDIDTKFSATWSNSANILHCILEGKWFENTADVIVETENILVKNGQSVCKFVLPGIALQPTTCRGLKMTSTRELHFSIKGVLNTEDEVYRMQVKTFSMQNETVEKIQKLQNKWYCAICKQKILADWSILTRVLPLPSENWSDFTDMWFCHNHGNENHGNEEASTQKQGRLLPKERECFVGETYVLVARRYVNSGGVKVTKSGSVLCKHCGRQLGEAIDYENGMSTEDQVLKFYLHTLLIKDLAFSEMIHSDIGNSDRIDLDSFFSSLLLEQSNTFASYRFIVESRPGTASENAQDKSSTCLLWMLDSNVQIYKSDVKSENDVTLNGVTNYSSVTQVGVKRTAATKVMFKCQLCGLNTKRSPDYVTKSVISLWRKDNTVHGFTLPHPIFLQLVNLLIQNCKTLPASQRYLNGFHISASVLKRITHCLLYVLPPLPLNYISSESTKPTLVSVSYRTVRSHDIRVRGHRNSRSVL